MPTPAVHDPCQNELPHRAIEGIQLFNQGLYFEAHEALEDAWRAEKGLIRDLYRAILQIGLGYYQIKRQNYRGALKMFKRCKRWLEPFPDTCQGVDLQDLRKNYSQVEDVLRYLGSQRMDEFPTTLIKPVKFTTSGSTVDPTPVN